MEYKLKFEPKTMTEEEAKHIEQSLKTDFDRVNELYAYREFHTGEDDPHDYTINTYYDIWLYDFRKGMSRMCEQNLGRPGNTSIQNIAYEEIKRHNWSHDEIDFLFKICCEFGFHFVQDYNEDNDTQVLYGDFDKYQIQYWCVDPWQICYAYLKCNENGSIKYEKPIKEICTDLLDYIYNELS